MSVEKKTLLLLGGSAQQVIAINKAKELGFRTVLCDYLPDNPGQYSADTFYLVSTTDKEAVLDVAQKEHVDGVVAYSSDPAAPTAAYVAEKMGLPGIPYRTAKTFCEKHLFRRFLQEHGFNVPASRSVDLNKDFHEIDLSDLRFPLVVKPTDSSGSKGVTIVESTDDLGTALQDAAQYSRNNVAIVEEYIPHELSDFYEAELFVVNNEIVFWGIFDSARDEECNPILPAGDIVPSSIGKSRDRIVRDTLARLVHDAEISNGALNIEMVFDSSERLFILDAGPRNGGNMLPEFFSMVSGKDLVEATILAAMGKSDVLDISFDGCDCDYWSLAIIHSDCSGLFKGITYSQIASARLVREELLVQPGASIKPFERCNDLVGFAFFRFKNKEEQSEVMNDIRNAVHVDLCKSEVYESF